MQQRDDCGVKYCVLKYGAAGDQITYILKAGIASQKQGFTLLIYFLQKLLNNAY